MESKDVKRLHSAKDIGKFYRDVEAGIASGRINSAILVSLLSQTIPNTRSNFSLEWISGLPVVLIASEQPQSIALVVQFIQSIVTLKVRADGLCNKDIVGSTTSLPDAFFITVDKLLTSILDDSVRLDARSRSITELATGLAQERATLKERTADIEKILDLNIGVERPTSTQEKAALIIRAAGSKSKFRDFSQDDQAVISRAGGLEHAKKQMKFKV